MIKTLAAVAVLTLALTACSSSNPAATYSKLVTKYDRDVGAIGRMQGQADPDLTSLVAACASAAEDARSLVHELRAARWPASARGAARALATLTEAQTQVLDACSTDASDYAALSDLSSFPDSSSQEQALSDELGISKPLAQ